MAREKHTKAPSLQTAFDDLDAAMLKYAVTITELKEATADHAFKRAGELLKAGHDQVLALKDCHNNLYTHVKAPPKPKEAKSAMKPKASAVDGDPEAP